MAAPPALITMLQPVVVNTVLLPEVAPVIDLKSVGLEPQPAPGKPPGSIAASNFPLPQAITWAPYALVPTVPEYSPWMR